LKILFLADNYPPETNAAALRVHERAVHWLKWGHQVTVITSVPNFPEGVVHEGYRNRWRQEEVIDGIRVIRVKTFIAPNKGVTLRILDFMSYMATSWWAGLFQGRPDVVVATSPQFFCAVSGGWLARIKRVPFVFELSDLWPASIRAVGAMRNRRILKTVEKMELAMYRRATRIVALTDAFRADLVERGIDGGKIDVVRNGSNHDFLQPGPPDLDLARSLGVEGKFVVAYVGTQGLAHGLLNVLEAAERLRDEPEVVFLFVGAGATTESLKSAARDRRLTNVVFVDRQPRERIVDYWRIADVSLVHLKNDPVFATVLPSKIFESMAMGLPMIYAGPAGEASELIHQHKAGVVVPPGNPAALAKAVLELKGDPLRYESLAAASRAAAPLHTRETQAEQFIEVLERVAGIVAVPRHAAIEAGDAEPVTAEAAER